MTAITMPTTSNACIPDLINVQLGVSPIERTDPAFSRFLNYQVISWRCPASNAIIR